MFRRLLSFTFFSLGLVLLILFIYSAFQRVNPWGLEKGFEEYVHVTEETRSFNPKRVVIDSIGTDLPLIPSSILDNKFETTKDGVSYLTSSGVPGQSGNVILYGHNWKNILGNLPKIQVGDSIRIYTSATELYEYIVEYTATVTPDEVHILAQTDDARLTIYTCAGFLDTKRFVVVARLQN